MPGQASQHLTCCDTPRWSSPFKMLWRASLVAQCLRICLPVQGTRVQALVWEDPTCHRATKPLHHSYWACALEPTNHNYWAQVPQLLKHARLEPVLRNKRSHHNEKPVHHNEEQPLLAATRESPCAATKTQHGHTHTHKCYVRWGFNFGNDSILYWTDLSIENNY